MVSNFAPEIAKCEADADLAAIISAVGNPPRHTYVILLRVWDRSDFSQKLSEKWVQAKIEGYGEKATNKTGHL